MENQIILNTIATLTLTLDSFNRADVKNLSAIEETTTKIFQLIRTL